MSNLLSFNYNPDILSCLANLSNDEVFTPPEIANKMLDMLPEEIWSDENATFLDPACKTGVFLREIAKRLLKGLEGKIPDLQERIDHIYHKQLFGIAITDLTAQMSRRSVYCSKRADGPYSISLFDDQKGNIEYSRIEHTWVDGRCSICGASQNKQDRGDELETHAYEFIHVKPQEIYNMKFDVIISNPPYQLETGGAGRQAKPIYHLFVEQAKKLKPRFITMITPSRWFAGGMGLDDYRDTMMNDNHIIKIMDYANAKDCFPQNSIGGGVCYFLWDRNSIESPCEFTNVADGKTNTMLRKLDEFPVLVRYNQAVSILHKVISSNKAGLLMDDMSPLMPYGLSTDYRGLKHRQDTSDLVLYSSNDTTFIKREVISKGLETVDSYKILISKMSAEHAGEPDKDGKFRVIPSTMKVLKPGEVCTHSYFVIGNYKEERIAKNVLSYLQTCFVRFLVLQSLSSVSMSKKVFTFVPRQDFSKSWTDAELYAKYQLTEEEIAFIGSMIKPMDLNGDSDE